MSDKGLRRLERAAREGDREAARKYLRERVRLGFDPEPWWTPTAEQIECSETRVLPVARVGLVTMWPYVLIPETVVDTGPFYLTALSLTDRGRFLGDIVEQLGASDGFRTSRLPTPGEWRQIDRDILADIGSNHGRVVKLSELNQAANLGLSGSAWEWVRHIAYPTEGEAEPHIRFRVVGVV